MAILSDFSLLDKNTDFVVYTFDNGASFGLNHDDFDDNFEHHNCKIIDYGNGRRSVKYADKKIFCLPKKHRDDLSDFNAVNKLVSDNVLLDSEISSDSSVTRQRKDNIDRARQRIYDICLLNDFDYFFTGTFKPDDKINRENAQDVLKPLLKWLDNSVCRKGLRYLFVPELHNVSNGIHFHGLINNVFNLVDSGTRLVKGYSKPVKVSNFSKLHISDLDVRSIVYNVPEWKFGFTTCSPIFGSVFHVANYMIKYMVKDFLKDKSKICSHRYYHSRKNTVLYPLVSYTDISASDFDAVAGDPVYQPCLSAYFKYETTLSFDGANDEN